MRKACAKEQITGMHAADSGDVELGQYIHLRPLNDGNLITPFRNMARMGPEITEADVDRTTEAFYNYGHRAN